MTTTDSPAQLGDMARRLRVLAAALADGGPTPEQDAAWNAPYGPREEWDLRVEDAEAPGPRGPVPVRVYTPTVAATGSRPVLVFCHEGPPDGIFSKPALLEMREAHGNLVRRFFINGQFFY